MDYILNESISQQFNAFKEGYDSIMKGTAINIFRPAELMELTCGSSELDFKDLEKGTKYDGFEGSDTVIRYFWEIVHEFSDADKKMLLFFATGSDRVPVGGLAKLQFVIARNGGDSDQVPTSHTCFNVLMLCNYESKQKLKDRLMTALANSDCGFFLN